jgi:hypothetical protein
VRSLTSQPERRTSGPENFQSSAKKDFSTKSAEAAMPVSLTALPKISLLPARTLKREPVGVAQMDASIIAALAALAGAAIGGLTSFVSSRTQAKAQWLAQIQLRRQELYKEFIGDASKLFIHALQNDADKADVFALMALYAEVSRMRVLSTTGVVDSADQIVREIIDKYQEPNKTVPQLRDMAHSGLIDPLRNFSEACRAEFQSLHFPV